MEIGKLTGSIGGHTITRGHVNAFSDCAKLWGHKNTSCQNVGSQKGPAILTCARFFSNENFI